MVDYQVKPALTILWQLWPSPRHSLMFCGVVLTYTKWLPQSKSIRAVMRYTVLKLTATEANTLTLTLSVHSRSSLGKARQWNTNKSWFRSNNLS